MVKGFDDPYFLEMMATGKLNAEFFKNPKYYQLAQSFHIDEDSGLVMPRLDGLSFDKQKYLQACNYLKNKYGFDSKKRMSMQ